MNHPRTVVRSALGALASVMALLLGAGALAVVLATPAEAHTELVGTSPGASSVVGAPVDRVSLRFGEPPSRRLVQVAVIGPDGRNHAEGPPVVEGAVVSVGVEPLERAGHYSVSFRVAASDDHPETGTFDFTVSAAAAAAAQDGRAAGAAAGSTVTGSVAGTDTAAPAAETALSPQFRQPRAEEAGPQGGALLSWLALALAMLGLAVTVPLSRVTARRRELSIP